MNQQKEINNALQKIQLEASELIESYACDIEENTEKAQGMLNALQIMNDVFKKNMKGEQK